MKKLNTKAGFTLAELLIVVAIIAVLVAISIPVFSAQLERSREATDVANIRSAYAEIMTYAIDDETTAANLTSAVTSSGSITYSEGVYTAVIPAHQTDNTKWEDSNTGIALANMKTGSTYAANTTIAPAKTSYTLTYTVATKKIDVTSAS